MFYPNLYALESANKDVKLFNWRSGQHFYKEDLKSRQYPCTFTLKKLLCSKKASEHRSLLLR